VNIENKVKKGTTTLGLVFKDGVVLAADSQSTSAYVESRFERKVHPITDNIALTTAGVVGDLQFLIRLMKVEAKLYSMGNGHVTTKALATLLSNVLHSNRYYPYIAAMVIGGYDTENGPAIYSMDPYGGLGSGEKFFSTGSGSPLAMGVLQSQFKDDLTEKEAVELAKRALDAAMERDIYTGGQKLTVAVINHKGYKEV
jgi:proteasome beta subunit